MPQVLAALLASLPMTAWTFMIINRTILINWDVLHNTCMPLVDCSVADEAVAKGADQLHPTCPAG